MMRMQNIFTGLILCCPLASLSAFAEESPFSIQGSGSGCPKFKESRPASEAIEIKKDFGPEFRVARSKGAALSESRKNCSILVSSEGAPHQFALKKIDWDVRPKAGGSGKLSSSVDASSQGEAKVKAYALDSGAQTIEDKDLQWSSCGRGLLLNLKQRMEGEGEADIKGVTLNVKSRACAQVVK